MSAKSDEVSRQYVPLHQHAGHLIRRLNQRMLSTFSEKLSGMDVSNVQFAALEAISLFEPTTQKEIADYIAMEPSNMHNLLARLRDRKLISITIDQRDPRRNRVRLTNKGRNLLETVRPLEAQVEPALLAELSASEKAHLIKLLQKLVNL
ncbi:MAG: MarR family transcriptional regulator [Pseudomonadota bacterium]